MPTPYLTEEKLLAKLKSRNIKISPLFKKAFDQARKTHQNQKRDNGQPYLEEHIYPMVSDLADSYTDQTCPENLLIGALLHDVLEDDEDISDRKFIDQFGEEIYQIIKPVTKDKKDNSSDLTESQKTEINRKMIDRLAHSHQFTKLIKLADRMNNLLSESPKKLKFNRYVLEAEEFFLPFAKKESRYYYEKLKALIPLLKKHENFH